jgi:anti-sigma factor RsiW
MPGGTGEAAPVGEHDKQAWVDGRLPPDRRKEVEAWMAANPDEAARLRAMAADREALRAALRFKAEEPVPPRLRVDSIAAAPRAPRRPVLRRVAAACGWLALGAAAGWGGRGVLFTDPSRNAPPGVVAEAIAAHRVFVADARRPVEVAAEQEAQLVRWLSNRLARPLTAPDLAHLDYRLIGGRLLPGADGNPAAQLMYERPGGARLTVYLRADPAGGGETAFHYAENLAQGLAAFWWVDRGFGYAVSAEDTDRTALLRAAEAVHRQLAGAPPAGGNRGG